MSRLITPAGQAMSELAARVAEGQRMSRGRKYHRQGKVFDLDVNPGIVTASVAGSRAEPYEVSIACKHANENERRASMEEPDAAVPRVVDVAFTCICPDWGDPCKHGVAVLLAFAEAVDADASLLYTWRKILDVVPPPPPGTESLEIHGPGSTAGLAPRHDADGGDAQPGLAGNVVDLASRRVAKLRTELGDSIKDPAAVAKRAERQRTEPEPEPRSSALVQFFSGEMPTVATDLVGPLDEVQLDAYGRARIPVEDVNAAEIIADALESVAEHWLKR